MRLILLFFKGFSPIASGMLSSCCICSSLRHKFQVMPQAQPPKRRPFDVITKTKRTVVFISYPVSTTLLEVKAKLVFQGCYSLSDPYTPVTPVHSAVKPGAWRNPVRLDVFHSRSAHHVPSPLSTSTSPLMSQSQSYG